MTPAKTPAEDKRSRILDAALDRFREQGFEQTTMREIAAQAGVALGLAYYHFGSKEALVMAFYERATGDLQERVSTALDGKTSLKERIQAVLECKLAYFLSNRRFLGALLSHSADPEDPLSPFSEATSSMRDADVENFKAVIGGSDVKPPKDLAPVLPRLLWLYQMGIILFWLYDRSPDQERTKKLIDKSLDLIVGLIRLSRFPLLRGPRKLVVELVETVS